MGSSNLALRFNPVIGDGARRVGEAFLRGSTAFEEARRLAEEAA